MMLPFAPLRSTMITISVACVAGAAVIGGLALDWVSWPMFVTAGVVGLVLGWPLGLWVAHRMRDEPPLPRPERADMDPDAAQRAVDPFRAKPYPYPPAPDQVYAPGRPMRSGL